MRRKADFLIAGVQKGGTTALHHYLSRHPDIFMPESKELHFFDNESRDWSATQYTEYDEHFAPARDHQSTGEATPIYTFWPPAMHRIARYNPDIRLIVLLRHPVERAFSHWRMETRRGSETLGFGEAIREGRIRVAADAVGFGPGFRNFSYVERGFYAEQILRIYSFFPRNRVLFSSNRLMRENFQAVFDQVTDFLQISRMHIPDVRNVSPAVPGRDISVPLLQEDAQYLRQLYAADISDTQALSGIDLNP